MLDFLSAGIPRRRRGGVCGRGAVEEDEGRRGSKKVAMRSKHW